MSRAGFVANDLLHHYDAATDHKDRPIQARHIDPRLVPATGQHIADRAINVMFEDGSAVVVAIWGTKKAPE